MIVVSDTSPINYLTLIGQEPLLPLFFGSILIPAAVRDELLDAGAPAEVQRLMGQLPDWLGIIDRHPESDAGLQHLHPGERDVTMKADLILMDEAQGRAAARIWVLLLLEPSGSWIGRSGGASLTALL